MPRKASGYRSVYFAAQGAPDGDPDTDTTSSWNGPYRMKGGADPEMTPNSTPDGIGRAMQSTSTFTHTFEIPDTAAKTALDGISGNVDVAYVKADGGYEFVKDVIKSVRMMPNVDRADFQTVRVYLQKTEVDTVPTTTYP